VGTGERIVLCRSNKPDAVTQRLGESRRNPGDPAKPQGTTCKFPVNLARKAEGLAFAARLGWPLNCILLSSIALYPD